MPLKRGSKAVFCRVGTCKKRYFTQQTLDNHIRSTHPRTKEAKALGSGSEKRVKKAKGARKVGKKRASAKGG